jgi:hypothetical protein
MEKTITIGNQVWTSKNLDVETYRNGDVIPQVQDQNAWNNLTTGAWCYYDNDASNGTKYGKLYNWYAVNDPRGLAPNGYHIPTDAEWTTLVNYLGGGIIISGLPGGARKDDGTFVNVGVGSGGNFWSATQNSSSDAWYRNLANGDGKIYRFGNNKKNGYSVLCLRD